MAASTSSPSGRGARCPDRDARAAHLARNVALDAARAVSVLALQADVNVSDNDSPEGIYLTATGLSAESGDDGQVGRSNRVNGLISPYRPMSLEAACGNNPVAHAVIAEVPEVEEAYCHLLSRIGHRIDQPEVFEIKARLAEGPLVSALTRDISEVAGGTLDGIGSLRREAVAGALTLG